MTRVVLDTGPLVASFVRSERRHNWAKEQLARLRPPLFTCDAVLSEACFLLASAPRAVAALFELLRRETIVIDFSARDHHGAIGKLMQRYANVPMSFADACLVRMCEIADGSTVLTLDADFSVYRKNGRQVIATIAP